jgi:hypothetical protein
MADTGRDMGGISGSVRKWQAFIAAAALYNLVIGLPGLFGAGASTDARLISLFVCCFGLLYGLVARDPVRLGPALWAGVAGKLGVIALMAPAVRAGAAVPGLGWVLAGDALFTAGFLAFLRRRRAA